MDTRLRTGKILRDAAALAAGNAGIAIAVLLVMTAVSVASDFYPDLGVQFTFGLLGMVFVAQYLVMRHVMTGAGLPVSSRSGVGKSFLGIVIAVGLVSGMGLILLIVPGVYLYTRWSLAVPIAIGEGERMSEAMSLSRDRTEGNIVPIAIALIIANLPWAIAIVAAVMLYTNEAVIPLLLSIAVNTGAYLSDLATWFCMIAAYIQLRPTHELEEVFA